MLPYQSKQNGIKYVRHGLFQGQESGQVVARRLTVCGQEADPSMMYPWVREVPVPCGRVTHKPEDPDSDFALGNIAVRRASRAVVSSIAIARTRKDIMP